MDLHTGEQHNYVFISTMYNIFQTPTSVETSSFFSITNWTLQWNKSLDGFKKWTQLLSQECPICASMGVLISRITRCGMTWKRFAYYQTFVIYGESINDMDFPQKGPTIQRLNVVFDVKLNKLLYKWSGFRWFKAPWPTIMKPWIYI